MVWCGSPTRRLALSAHPNFGCCCDGITAVHAEASSATAARSVGAHLTSAKETSLPRSRTVRRAPHGVFECATSASQRCRVSKKRAVLAMTPLLFFTMVLLLLLLILLLLLLLLHLFRHLWWIARVVTTFEDASCVQNWRKGSSLPTNTSL